MSTVYLLVPPSIKYTVYSLSNTTKSLRGSSNLQTSWSMLVLINVACQTRHSLSRLQYTHTRGHMSCSLSYTLSMQRHTSAALHHYTVIVTVEWNLRLLRTPSSYNVMYMYSRSLKTGVLISEVVTYRQLVSVYTIYNICTCRQIINTHMYSNYVCIV